MIIKHLSHSGFIVEDHNDTLLFDPISPITPFDENKTIYTFSSHSHHDHFKMEIMEDFYKNEQAHFILSKDFSQKISEFDITNLLLLEPYEKITINDVGISAYGSTDLGNSYLVSLHGKNFFHSGDLNWWHWKRMTPKELGVEESDFKREVDLLKDKSIDFAFVPVDPRLEEHAYLAINYFIETVNPTYVIPMHSFGQYDFYKDLGQHIDLKDSTLLNTDRENQVIYEK